MTERQWLTTDQVTWLLCYAGTVSSERKLSLFQTECARQLSAGDDISPICEMRKCVEVAIEEVPIGFQTELIVACREYTTQTYRQLRLAVAEARGKDRHFVQEIGRLAVAANLLHAVASRQNWWTWTTDVELDEWPYYRAYEGVREAVCRLNIPVLHCIVGNPFRPVAFDSAWRSETAVALAAGIYTERAFDRLPILADALEEAGCDHPDILTHCRGPGQHSRGCWVVDGVLGKQ